jgi:hypothetical protein
MGVFIMNPDFNTMTKDELRQYVITHQADKDAIEKLKLFNLMLILIHPFYHGFSLLFNTIL